jgi:MFS family permease
MSTVASSYAALTISGSATAMGLAGAAPGISMLLLLLVGGVIADRFNRKAILLITQCLLGLAAAAIAFLGFANRLEVWHLVALGLTQGVLFAVGGPTRQSFLADLAGPKLLPNAMALFNVGINLSRIVGPALAGALLSLEGLGTASVFAFMTLIYAVILPVIVGLPVHRRDEPPALKTAAQTGWEQLLGGLHYIVSSRRLLGLIGLAFAGSVFGLPFQQIMPVFTERVFEVGASGLGIILSSLGIGALVGSLAVGPFATSSKVDTLQYGSGLGFGLLLVLFGLAPEFTSATVLMFIIGAVSAAFIALNNAVILTATDRPYFGRVVAVYGMTFAVMPIAALPLAWLTEQIGPRPTVVAEGVVLTLAVLIVMMINGAGARGGTIASTGRQ